jgi:hypothetical protein
MLFPVQTLVLFRLSAFFLLADSTFLFLNFRQSRPSVLMRSSNQYLLATAIRPGSKPA